MMMAGALASCWAGDCSGYAPCRLTAGADKTVTTLEDTDYTFAAADFGFTDTDGNALSAVKITTLPGAGSLTLGGVAVVGDGLQGDGAQAGGHAWGSFTATTPLGRQLR